MGWFDRLFSNAPQSPPPHPASRNEWNLSRYNNLPTMTAPIEDRRGDGQLNWASRPHDQSKQSTSMAGYVDPNLPLGGPAYQWLKTHGLTGDLPTTPMADAGEDRLDPSIMANTKIAWNRAEGGLYGPFNPTSWGQERDPPQPQPNPFTPDQITNRVYSPQPAQAQSLDTLASILGLLGR